MAKKTSTSDYMNQLRLIVLDCYKDGRLLDVPIKRYVRKEMDSDRIKLMIDMSDLLMNSDYIGDESKLFLSMPYINYQGIVDEIYLSTGKLSNISTVQSKLWYDKNKIVKDLGSDMPMDIIEYTNRDITIYMNNVASLRLKVNKVDLLSELALKLSKDVVYCDSINDEEFEEFLDVIAPYTKKCINLVENNIDKRILGYIRYITTHSVISDTDIGRYKQLKELIK